MTILSHSINNRIVKVQFCKLTSNGANCIVYVTRDGAINALTMITDNKTIVILDKLENLLNEKSNLIGRKCIQYNHLNGPSMV